ncbi:hypothetical protein JAAARDRAFT_402709 [Jaapia argillacea MUCL 33604]|uniref:Uncharacterized protein n=1 Tax=Jaapia argillacea MUCL 33604 TaxID=933084 RepID=A0A067PHE7_9AGAM|nr:hypothetical protein JAAARDRAFT_402709 [Jaapia argillacea MUCL 33604]
MLDPGYAITRPYPWPRFGPIFLVVSCIVLIVLTLLNVAVTGYETVTVARSNKNVTQQMWWTPFIPRSLRATMACDSHLLNVGDTFTTNNGMFQWSVTGVSNSDYDEPFPDAGFEYSARPMSFCAPSRESNATSITADVTTAAVTAWLFFICDTGTGLVFEIQGTWKWQTSQPATDKQISPVSSIIYFIIEFILKFLAQDLLDAALIPPPPGIEAPLRIIATGGSYCPSLQNTDGEYLFQPNQAEALQCAQEPLHVNFSGGVFSSIYDSYKLNATGLDFTNTALRNFLKASVAAAEIDLGIYRNSSLYFDMEMFNATIEANPMPYALMNNTGMNISNAQYLRMAHYLAIPIDGAFQRPSIINVSYLCHELRIKSPLSFISSVFVGTISMFMAFRSFVLLIANILAKRYSEKANHCEGSLALEALEEGRSPVEGREVQAAVPSIEIIENDVMLEMETFHGRTGSEVTLSAQPATSHLSKDDGTVVYNTEGDSQSSELSTLLGETPEET